MNAKQRERELVEAMLAGDEAAFETFSDDYIPVLYRFAFYRVDGDRELANEVVQSSLTKVIAKLGTFRGEAALSTWLCAVCRNEIAAHFRRRERHGHEVEFQVIEDVAPESLGQRPDSPEGSLLRQETSNLVHVALDALPPHYGRALEWKYIDNLPVQEIADRLEVGLKAAESLLTRARGSFKRAYTRLVEAVPDSLESPQVAAARLEAES